MSRYIELMCLLNIIVGIYISINSRSTFKEVATLRHHLSTVAQNINLLCDFKASEPEGERRDMWDQGTGFNINIL